MVFLRLVQYEGLDHEIATAGFGEAAEALGRAIHDTADDGYQRSLCPAAVDRLFEPSGHVRSLAAVVVGDLPFFFRGLVDLAPVGG